MGVKYFTVTIPVKSYLRKYIISKYGETIILNEATIIGFVLINTITSRAISKMNKGYIDLWQKRLNDEIVFQIPFTYFSLSRHDLSVLTFFQINRFLEHLFENELFMYIDFQSQKGVEIKTAIELFCKKYSIDLEIDITFDALKRRELRLRKKKIKKSNQETFLEKTLFG